MLDQTPSETADPIELLRALVACPSVTPDEGGVMGVLEQFLARYGFSLERLVFKGDGSYAVDNLFATATLGDEGPHLLLAGHTDVVPPGPEEDWQFPPFGAHVAQGVMHGRGTVDMKSGVAAMCVAAARAASRLDRGRISLLITNDEEADAVNGTDKVMQWAKAQGHRFDFAIVGEPSSNKRLGDRLKIGRRGSLNGRISVTGRQGHSAYPNEALNPLPVLAEIAGKLANTPLDDGSAAFEPSTVALTNFEVGNKATNVIPGKGVLAFNVRFNDLWTDEKLVAWVNARIAEVETKGCTVEFTYPRRNSQSFVCPPGGAVALLDEVIAQRFGAKPVHSTTGGTSDARFITQYCPVVECGLVGATMHQVNEQVPIADVSALSELYEAFIARFMSGSGSSQKAG